MYDNFRECISPSFTICRFYMIFFLFRTHWLFFFVCWLFKLRMQCININAGEKKTPSFQIKLFIHFTLNNKFYSHLTVCMLFFVLVSVDIRTRYKIQWNFKQVDTSKQDDKRNQMRKKYILFEKYNQIKINYFLNEILK